MNSPTDITLEQFGIDRLDPEQRCELIGLIWDSLPDDVYTPPQWHWEILERRIEEADADPDGFEPFESVLNRLSHNQ